MVKRGMILALLAGLFGASEQPATAQTDDPDFLSIGAGWFDFNRRKDPGAEFRIEYRSGYKVPYVQFKPFVALGGATSGHGFIGAGILWDVYFGRRWVVTPSFAPHFYTGSKDKLDMGHALEFRSQLEAAYRFDDRSRLGLAISHYSNAGLGDKNPGTETLSVYYSLPIN
ncbi:acyloxyacyl hydrolase [Magnetospira thiophila]